MNCRDLSISEIRDRIKSLFLDDLFMSLECGDRHAVLKDIIFQLEKDSRKGVKELKKTLTRAIELEREEHLRWRKMQAYENVIRREGYKFIAGADEAGIGPLAGPVVAAAVILDPDVVIPGINDSKKLSESKRKNLYEMIMGKAVGVGVGVVHNDVIDKINILRASLEAMRLAVCNLPIEPDFLLVDGKYTPDLSLPMKPLINGDNLSLSIASASIIAKVTRDRIMLDFDKQYPQYGFEHNKGYPTPDHLTSLGEFGICEIHRKSFAPVAEILKQTKIQFP